jgi:hypothetical protein
MNGDELPFTFNYAILHFADYRLHEKYHLLEGKP